MTPTPTSRTSHDSDGTFVPLQESLEGTAGEGGTATATLTTPTASFAAVIDELEQADITPQRRGRRFERLMLQCFRKDPYWSSVFSEVKLWEDWEDKPTGWPDLGIDIVAKFADSVEGEPDWCAIQCKYHKRTNKVNKTDLSKFLAASESSFRQRILACTSDLNRNALKVAEKANPHLTILDWPKLAQSKFKWATLRENVEATQYTGVSFKPRPHQVAAINNVLSGFYGPDEADLDTAVQPTTQPQAPVDRGQIRLPCGTGKTFTALKLAEQAAQRLNKQPLRVLYLMPSISLLAQNMREWAEQKDPGMVHKYIGVCSDRTAGKHRDDTIGYLTELEGEVTTDPDKIATRLSQHYPNADLLVVFSTYQSSHLVAEAQKHGAPGFDLTICDEAHRTTGVEAVEDKTEAADSLGSPGSPGSPDSPDATQDDYGPKFLLVHREDLIKSHKRLYMTATPKVYLPAAKTKAQEQNRTLFSMDDDRRFGPIMHEMSFGQAITDKLLTDYSILAITIDPAYQEFLKASGKLNPGTDDEINFQIKTIGTVKALSGGEADEWRQLRRSLAFTNRIKDSKAFAAGLPVATETLNSFKSVDEPTIKLAAQHIEGSTPADERRRNLEWLADPEMDDELRVISNAKCLSEGVDVPVLDAALFMAPKHSEIDIIQQVGRIMRKAEGKQRGYVVVPMLLADETTTEEAVKGSKDYQTILKVARALKAHDAQIADMLNFKNLPDSRIEVRHVTPTERELDSTELDETDKAKIYQQLTMIEEDLVEAVKVGLYDGAGDKEYWKKWATDIGMETQQLQDEILKHLKTTDKRAVYDRFLEGARQTLSANITDKEAVSFLAQHIVTKPVFESLYEHYGFAENNSVSVILNTVCDELEQAGVGLDLIERHKEFYSSVKKQVNSMTGVEARHELIKELYETFLTTAFPEETEKQGVVYTPIEIVDWLCRSVDDVLRAEFGMKLEDEGVDILDPFTGAGTFPVRLIQLEHQREDEPERTHLIATDKLPHKFRHELHAMEIMPTAYYIADVNIEEAYHGRMQEQDPNFGYENYDGIALGDTFMQPMEGTAGQAFKADLFGVEEDNTPQLKRIAEKNIKVIITNPPWRAGQKDATDDNQNNPYPELDALIDGTYAHRSTSTNKNALYDLYFKALRWSSTRLGDEGVIAIVTNGGWLDGAAASGVRACLEEEFDKVYVYNLRGRLGMDGEGGNVFDVKVPVTMMVLVKKRDSTGKCQIFYNESKENSTKQEKLGLLAEKPSLEKINWSLINPDKQYDWINQRDTHYQNFFSMGDKATKAGKSTDSIFYLYSNGVKTQRDTWAYNSNRGELAERSMKAIDFFHSCFDTQDTNTLPTDSKIFKWHRESENALKRSQYLNESIPIRKVMFRPFYPQYLHFEKGLNAMHYRVEDLFPLGINDDNLAIGVSGKSGSNFSALMFDMVSDLNIVAGGAVVLKIPVYQT